MNTNTQNPMMKHSRLSWLVIVVGLALFTLSIGWGVNKQLIDQRISFASDRLLLLSNLRREALERYFATAEAELRFWSTSPGLIKQQLWLNDAWQKALDAGRDPEQRLKLFYVDQNPNPPGQRRELSDAGDGSGYSALHAELHPMARLFVEVRDYYDFFLISPTGDIHYSVEKEADFATNLNSGPYKDSGLAQAFKRALQYARSDEIAVSDLEGYAPSDGAPAMFVAKAMYGSKGELAGVIALQLPINRITDIMNFDAGMHKTGETYIVGEDLLMRSDSRFSEESTILKQAVDTETVNRALKGEYGVDFTNDYRGIEVLSAYSSTQVDDHNWAVMAEIDKAEILEMATSERPLLAGLMLFFYSLGLWSFWYVQRSSDDVEGASLLADLDLDSGMDLSDS